MGMGLSRWHVGKEEVRPAGGGEWGVGGAKEPEAQRSEMVLSPEKPCCGPAHVGHGHTYRHVICQRPTFLPTCPQGLHLSQPHSAFGGNDQPELGRPGRGFISS